MARVIPTNYEQARELADQARARAYARIDHHIQRESMRRTALEIERLRDHWWQFWRPNFLPPMLPFDMAVDRRVADDVDYAVAISDNQWYIQYATMYAQGEQLDELRRIAAGLPVRSPRLAARTDYPEAA